MNARSTFADVEKAAQATLRGWTDATTPDGVFGAVANILGVVTTYYFTGEIGDSDATVVARVEATPHGHQNHYIGDRIKGGFWVGADSFPQMLRTAAGSA